ncbi:MAG TPA: hypothetical protein VK094_00420 [Pseudogracilibacillus sp.]|nr:hypothetical protein [Pseudogracilibacillus sp.]
MKHIKNTSFELLEIIDTQQNIINKQHETLANLVNENVEKEALINELMRGENKYL